MNSTRLQSLASASLALGLLLLSACASDTDEQGEAADTEGDVAETTQALPIGGGSTGTTSSCSAPPLQCGRSFSTRAIYPGCSVSCSKPRTAMCLSGDCTFKRAASCTCLEPLYIP